MLHVILVSHASIPQYIEFLLESDRSLQLYTFYYLQQPVIDVSPSLVQPFVEVDGVLNQSPATCPVFLFVLLQRQDGIWGRSAGQAVKHLLGDGVMQ
jgi:hypothetical protein